MLTYLLGAGASAHGVPMAAKLKDEIKQFRNHLEDTAKQLQKENNILEKDQQLAMLYQLLEKTDNIIRESEKHQTVDTYARRLYLTEETHKLQELKIILTLFFMFYQLTHSPDKRYDHFLASLLQKKDNSIVLPSDLTVLSWNYDFQFEKAMSIYAKSNQFADIAKSINILPTTNNRIEEKHQIIKLNGSSFFYDQGNDYLLSPELSNESIPTSIAIKTVLKFYNDVMSSDISPSPLISFAWEFEKKTALKRVLTRIFQTKILVITGYSFPNFNREIDYFLFDFMRKIEKIYIQEPDQRVAEGLEIKIKALAPHLIEQAKFDIVTDTTQFHIPMETEMDSNFNQLV